MDEKNDARLPKPPRAYEEFVSRYPHLRAAWESINDQGAEGPLDNKTQRLIKLAIAIGAMRQGAVHASARKGLALEITVEELEQVVALSAGTMGLPACVAAFSWVHDEVRKQK